MEKTLRIVYSQEEIRNRIRALADEISRDARLGEVTIVGILDDAFVFLADLIRSLDVPLSCCFMKVSRQRHGGQSEIMFTSDFDPRGRDILLVGGVVATGVTLDYITKHLSDRGVKSLHTCMLVDKPDERRVDVRADFTAFRADGGFIFGYGLGVQNQYRQLPYLAVME
ncbi:MAG TPA: phosphoribosyltransferase family protein [Blastocatellia bacterium]|jgi:hypoxanthine phosphoribosyltransferase|nr:phosphoribosyltransferase family protein [Blastocatellia bacterium]